MENDAQGASWLYTKASMTLPDFKRQSSAVSTGSMQTACPEVDERHVDKEDALVRAICNVFDSESESEDSVGPSACRPAAKRRRCTQGTVASHSEVSESSNQSEGSVVRLRLGQTSTSFSGSLSQEQSAALSHRLVSSSSSARDSEAGDEQRSRKQKVEWTQELHDRFVCAVEALPAKDQIPSKILDHMGPIAARLTRQNVASHLQKYRARKKVQDSFCRNAPAYFQPTVYPCWALYQQPMPGMGWQGAAAACMPQSAWVPAAPMIPTPLPQLFSQQDILDMIAEVLSKRKGKQHMPIGLKLDTGKVLDAVNKGIRK